MKSRVCTIADIRALELQPAQLSEDPRVYFPSDLDDAVFNELLAPYARTVDQDGKPIACYGIVIRWPGMAEAWGFFSQAALNHPTYLIRELRHWLKMAEEQFGLRRIEAAALEERAEACRFLIHLGFVPEARLASRGLHGGTHILYGRVK